MKKSYIILIVVILLIAGTGIMIMSNNVTGNIVKGNRHAIIETAKGNIEFELFEDKAPLTTKNFISLAGKGFYDGLTFHRVVPDFVYKNRTLKNLRSFVQINRA